MDLEQRFWSKVDKTGQCWIWTAAKNKGYGIFSIGKKNKFAHRVSYELFYKSSIDGILICHKCDNPSCVNPQHLFLGTHHDNTMDAMAKGRMKLAWVDEMRSRTKCKNGHNFDSLNTHIRKDGTRNCKKCTMIRNKKRRLYERSKANTETT